MTSEELRRLLTERGVQTTAVAPADTDVPGQFLVFLVRSAYTDSPVAKMKSMPELGHVEKRHNRFIYRVTLA